MILGIQTLGHQHCVFICNADGVFLRETHWDRMLRDRGILQRIDTLLQGKVPDHIIVFAGMGSYTGTRIGVSVANSLAFGWNISVGALLTDGFVGDQAGDEWMTPYISSFLREPIWKDMALPVYSQEVRIG
jgi:hypothetical protein